VAQVWELFWPFWGMTSKITFKVPNRGGKPRRGHKGFQEAELTTPRFFASFHFMRGSAFKDLRALRGTDLQLGGRYAKVDQGLAARLIV